MKYFPPDQPNREQATPPATMDALLEHIDYLKRRIARLEAEAVQSTTPFTFQPALPEAQGATQQAQIQQSEERFRQFAEHVREVFLLSTLDRAQFLYISPAFGQLWEEPESLLYKNPGLWLKKIYPADQEAVARALQRSRTSGLHEVEYRLVRNDGSLRWVRDRAYPVRNPNGTIYRVASIIEDITDQHAAEEKILALNAQLAERVEQTGSELASTHQRLRISEARLFSIFETMPAYVWFKDMEGRILLANSRFHELLPLAPDVSPIGKTTEELWPPERAQRYAEEDAKALATGQITRMEEHLVENGQSRWLELVKAPSHDANGALIGCVGYAHDITQRKLSEAALLEAREMLERRVAERTIELQSMNEELESFSYSVSHDLRAPLRSIDGFTRILLEEHAAALAPQAQHYLERVIESSRQMNLLIDNLLTLSRTSRTDLEKTECDLTPLATDIVQSLRNAEPERAAMIHIAQSLPVYGDPHLLKIVLDNLLRNAWKFTRHRTQTEISVGRASELPEQPYFVRDNGVGFDMAYAGKLFAPFQRLHGVKDFEGTGIGLTIVRRIILRHGGRVWAESAVNMGTTLFFTLPAFASASTHL